MKQNGILVAFKHIGKEKENLAYLNSQHSYTASTVIDNIYDRALFLYVHAKQEWDLNVDGISVVYFKRLDHSAIVGSLTGDSLHNPYSVVLFGEADLEPKYLVRIQFKDKDTKQCIAETEGEIILSTVFPMSYEQRAQKIEEEVKDTPKGTKDEEDMEASKPVVSPDADAILNAL